MRIIVRSARWEFDLDVGRREPAEAAVVEDKPTVHAGYTTEHGWTDTMLGFTSPGMEDK